jgi:integrase
LNHKNTFLDIVEDGARHKTAAIPGTLTSVPNYPNKLKIYLNNASPYWQAMYFDQGTTYRHSCKTYNKAEAYERAKMFYEMLILRKYQHPAHLEPHNHFIGLEKQSAERKKLNFEHVANEWLIRKSALWSPRHKVEVQRRLMNNVFPYIRKKNIQRISTNEVLVLLQRIEERRAFDLSHRVLNDLSQIWRYAMASGICKRDVTEGLSVVLHPHAVNHQKAVQIDELPKLLGDIQHYNKTGDEITRYALQILALTFVRKTELLHATWDEFDLVKAIWKIPASRMKMRQDHVVPLSKQVLALLKVVKNTFPSDEYVFNNGDPKKTVRDNALIEAIYWLGYKNKMTAHGFRAIASTVLNEQGFRADVIERQLAHAEPNQVRRAYNRAQYVPERTEMMQWWADYLEKLTIKSST